MIPCHCYCRLVNELSNGVEYSPPLTGDVYRPDQWRGQFWAGTHQACLSGEVNPVLRWLHEQETGQANNLIDVNVKLSHFRQ